MLVNLTPNIKEIERRKKVAIEYKFKFVPQSDEKFIIEKGIYENSLGYSFSCEEFIEKMDSNYNDNRYELNKKTDETLLQYYSREYKNWVLEYGVADNIEQIKKLYKKQINNKKEKFIISITKIYQNKEDGWRWHKWGKYIGKLNPQCEYLYDEDFGKDFECVMCFTLYQVY